VILLGLVTLNTFVASSSNEGVSLAGGGAADQDYIVAIGLGDLWQAAHLFP